MVMRRIPAHWETRTIQEMFDPLGEDLELHIEVPMDQARTGRITELVLAATGEKARIIHEFLMERFPRLAKSEPMHPISGAPIGEDELNQPPGDIVPFERRT